MSAWDTDLGRWRREWEAYLAQRTTNLAPTSSSAPEPAPDVGVSVADDSCDDEREAAAAVGVMPAPLLVYAEPQGET